ncbi:MAG: hypothetical protein ACLFPD_06690 [Desulfosudaceae bacterium]
MKTTATGSDGKKGKRRSTTRPERVAGLTIGALMVTGLCFFPAAALAAAEEGAGWRPVYDHIMLFVNFGILVYVIVRFGKDPLRNFFHDRRTEVADEIERLTTEKEKSLAAFEDMQKRLAEGDRHLRTIKERIRSEGEKIKEKMVADARKQGEFLLEGARKKVNNQYVDARRAFRADLIEAAVNKAAERLPQEIREEDHRMLVSNFLQNLPAS